MAKYDDMPVLDYATAVRNNLSGWWWASVAQEAGVREAATHPLPDEAEAAAHRSAAALVTLSSQTIELAKRAADALAHKAVEAYLASLPLLSKARRSGPIPKRLQLAVNEAMCAAEYMGQAAAKAHRSLALLSLLEGNQ